MTSYDFKNVHKYYNYNNILFELKEKPDLDSKELTTILQKYGHNNFYFDTVTNKVVDSSIEKGCRQYDLRKDNCSLYRYYLIVPIELTISEVYIDTYVAEPIHNCGPWDMYIDYAYTDHEIETGSDNFDLLKNNYFLKYKKVSSYFENDLTLTKRKFSTMAYCKLIKYYLVER